MSYDFSMEQEVTKVEEVAELNYTYNVAPMFIRALGSGGIHKLVGIPHFEAIQLLTAGIKDMDAHPKSYEELNPENGWGNFEGARMCLVTIRDWFLKYPDATFTIS